MSIVVEKIGNKNKPKSYRVKCFNCDSLLRFLETDEKNTYSIDGYMGPESASYITCPICKCKIITEVWCEIGYIKYKELVKEDF